MIPNQLIFWDKILRSLKTYNLIPYLHLWQRVSILQSQRKWKQIVNSRIFSYETACFPTTSEEKPVLKLTFTAFSNYSSSNFWSLTWNKPDLVPKIRAPMRLLVNAGLRRGVPWLQGTSDITCPLCTVEPEDNFFFMINCIIMKVEWDKF